MTGLKTNERPGVRAQNRYARVSAYKAREVLDLIRGKSVAEARAILEFTERAVAADVLKVLDSAVANAGHNNDIPPEELFISACFADEGPTLRRYRPRARGRAGRIRKRTCHITVIVGRYSVGELDRLREQRAGRRAATTDARTSRARRVARSRERSGEEAEAAAADDEPQTPEEAVEEIVDDTFAETAEDAGVADVEVDEDTDEAETDEVTDTEATDDQGSAEGSDDTETTDDQGPAEGSESKDS
jgi:large subunit ribosomal protein L22